MRYRMAREVRDRVCDDRKRSSTRWRTSPHVLFFLIFLNPPCKMNKPRATGPLDGWITSQVQGRRLARRAPEMVAASVNSLATSSAIASDSDANNNDGERAGERRTNDRDLGAANSFLTRQTNSVSVEQ